MLFVLIQKKKNDGCPRCRYSSKGRLKLKTSEIVGEKKKINIILEINNIVIEKS